MFLVATGEPPIDDPVARDVLARVPRMLRDEISESLKSSGPERWLDTFIRHMGQNLQVTKRSEDKIDVATGDFLQLVDATFRHFNGMIFAPRRGRRATPSPTKTTATSFMLEPLALGPSK